MFQPADHILWDIWFAFDGRRHHAYYLQAPKFLDDPEERHDLAEVGHAVSTDLVHWEERGVAFRAGPPGSWDDRSIYTGSVLEHDDVLHFFYTSTNRAEKGLVQRIGHAASTDYDTFERVDDAPILEVDPVWYESLGGPYDEVHWRDPWALVHNGRIHLYLTARVPTGAWDERGTIALATSDDFRTWTVHPPVCDPGDFWVLEVPQVLHRRERWWLIASTRTEWHSANRRERARQADAHSGLVAYVADRPTGPYRPARTSFVIGDPKGTYHTARIVPTADGDRLLAARFLRHGAFYGALSDPAQVQWDDDGPHVRWSDLWLGDDSA
jgi:beta-fructofuranosidase